MTTTVEDPNEGNLDDSASRACLRRVMTVRSGHGKCGSYTYDDRCLYIGDFDAQGVKSGLGHLEAPNGSTYDGQFEKGLPNGVGVMRFPDSSRYEGEFMQGWFHGHGVFATISGLKYEGEFRGGRIWGLGKLTFPHIKEGNQESEVSENTMMAASGSFRDTKFVADAKTAEASVARARKTGAYAKKLCNEMCFDDNWIQPLISDAKESDGLTKIDEAAKPEA